MIFCCYALVYPHTRTHAHTRMFSTCPASLPFQFVSAQKDLILGCLDDQDESIRIKALDLLGGMVSKKSLMDIVKRLLSHVETSEGASYRDEVVGKIIEICSQVRCFGEREGIFFFRAVL